MFTGIIYFVSKLDIWIIMKAFRGGDVMYIVRFHFIDKEAFRTKRIVLSRGCYISSAMPNKLLFITLENTSNEVFFLFLIKGRVNVRQSEIIDNMKHMILCGNGPTEKFTWHIDCNKSTQIYQPSMYLMSRMIRLISQNRFDDIHILSNKIQEYCEENKIVCYT